MPKTSARHDTAVVKFKRSHTRQSGLDRQKRYKEICRKFGWDVRPYKARKPGSKRVVIYYIARHEAQPVRKLFLMPNGRVSYGRSDETAAALPGEMGLLNKLKIVQRYVNSAKASTPAPSPVVEGKLSDAQGWHSTAAMVVKRASLEGDEVTFQLKLKGEHTAYNVYTMLAECLRNHVPVALEVRRLSNDDTYSGATCFDSGQAACNDG